MDLQKINKIFIDIDGVLTDDKFWITSSGEVSKGFCTKDVRAIRELIANGFEVYLVTASSWKGSEIFAKKTGAAIINERDKSKVDTTNSIIVINDSWDIPMMKNAYHIFFPRDYNKKILGGQNAYVSNHICERKGGEGVIDEVADIILFYK